MSGWEILFGVEAILSVVLVCLFVDFIYMFDIMLFSSFLLA
jgi:hypothetical protein